MPRWPEDLPQEFEQRGYREAGSEVLRSNMDQQKARQRSTATPWPMQGQMLMTYHQWRRLLAFHTTDLAGGVLSFEFPDPFATKEEAEAGKTITVVFDRPPIMSAGGGDTYRVTLRFLVHGGG